MPTTFVFNIINLIVSLYNLTFLMIGVFDNQTFSGPHSNHEGHKEEFEQT